MNIWRMFLLALMGFWIVGSQTFACLTLTLDQQIGMGLISSERAVIIWDSLHKTEHFIRQADFQTGDPNVGFIVPTPTAPEISEADPQIFEMAAEVSAPLRVPRKIYYSLLEDISDVMLGPVQMGKHVTDVFSSDSSRPKSFVYNVNQKDVGGYHAVTLKAEDAAGLKSWLQQNGYPWNDADAQWLTHYVEQHWFITAFKLINKDSSQRLLVSKALRLTFQADQPFYPYREPGGETVTSSSATPFGRVLQVTVLSDVRMEGSLANGKTWPGVLSFAGPSAPDSTLAPQWKSHDWLKLANLNTIEKPMALPKFVSSFLDKSNPRPGSADLIFRADPDQSLFRREEEDRSLPRQMVIEPGLEAIGVLLMVFVSTSCILSGRNVFRKPAFEPSQKPDWIMFLNGSCSMVCGMIWLITYSALVPITLMIGGLFIVFHQDELSYPTLSNGALILGSVPALLCPIGALCSGGISSGLIKPTKHYEFLIQPRLFGLSGAAAGVLFFIGVLIHHIFADHAHSPWTNPW